MRFKSVLTFATKHLLPALVVFYAAWWVGRFPWFQRQENVAQDEITALRAKMQPTLSPDDLVLLAIDKPSLAEFHAWPWPRAVHGNFSMLLGTVRPSVVAWDLLFTDPAQDEAQDEHFAKGIVAANSDVILGAEGIDTDQATRPDSAEAKASRLAPLTKVEGDRSQILTSSGMEIPAGKLGQVAEIGFVDTPPDRDGVRRRVPLVVRIGDDVYPTLSLRALMSYWRAKPSDVTVKLGDVVEIDAPLGRRSVPIDERGIYRINYRHDQNGFVLVGYVDAFSRLQARYQKQPARIPALTGRILVVGQTADGLTDIGPTPLSAVTPLVLVHTNVIENVLQQDYVHFVRQRWIWFGGLLLGIFGLARYSDRHLGAQVAFALGIPAAYFVAALLAFVNGSWIVPIVGPVSGFLALQMFSIARRVIAEQRKKEQIKGMFGAYLSPELISRMVDSGQMPQLGGHDSEITAYFSDIQGFSTFSEKLGSGPLVELMNEYLTVCTDIVQAQGGTLDKYIGDAVVAMFGAPIPMKDHAFRACVATQKVHLKLAELREKWKSEGDKWPEIVWKMQSRIGLNSGVCMIGNMGSRARFNYTMMGDNVNLAARMESGAKQWGAYTMCTEATKLACEKHGGDAVEFRPLGRIVVKGRTLAVPIYEIVGLKEHVTAQTRECVQIFSAGLDKYYARDWDGALKLFAQSRELEFNVPGKSPGVSSNPSLVYLEITEHFKHEPPPESWDGVYVMKEK